MSIFTFRPPVGSPRQHDMTPDDVVQSDVTVTVVGGEGQRGRVRRRELADDLALLLLGSTELEPHGAATVPGEVAGSGQWSIRSRRGHLEEVAPDDRIVLVERRFQLARDRRD